MQEFVAAANGTQVPTLPTLDRDAPVKAKRQAVQGGQVAFSRCAHVAPVATGVICDPHRGVNEAILGFASHWFGGLPAADEVPQVIQDAPRDPAGPRTLGGAAATATKPGAARAFPVASASPSLRSRPAGAIAAHHGPFWPLSGVDRRADLKKLTDDAGYCPGERAQHDITTAQGALDGEGDTATGTAVIPCFPAPGPFNPPAIFPV